MRLSLIILCLFMTGFTMAQVYRTVDKDGNVIFTDQATEGAEEVEIKELETIESLESASPAPNPVAVQKQAPQYSSLEITSPQNDLAIRDNTGNVTVSVVITPRLRSGHKLVLYLDGAEQSTGSATSFQLQNIDRGTHQLKVAVVDAAGQEQISSAAITFHLLRFATTNPGVAKPPAK